MNSISEFQKECEQRIASYEKNMQLRRAADIFIAESVIPKYSYNFTWLGRPIIQYPQDMIAVQEIIWQTKPDLIIETGIAHGGSLIFHASILQLLGRGKVLGIDLDIRKHNRSEIENHPLANMITMLEGSSTSPEIIGKVVKFALDFKKIMVVLDSNHTYDHVIKELELYAPIVSEGSYLIVFDTFIENLPPSLYPDRPWEKGNNPMTAVRNFLNVSKDFEVDRNIQNKLLITTAPEGYLRKKKIN